MTTFGKTCFVANTSRKAKFVPARVPLFVVALKGTFSEASTGHTLKLVMNKEKNCFGD